MSFGQGYASWSANGMKAAEASMFSTSMGSMARTSPMSPSKPGAKPGQPLSDVVQMLEHELSTERFERREEIGFLTKMHEREVNLLKSRAQSATQQLEEERRLFERESANLINKVGAAEERLRKEEDRANRLEMEVARLRAELEDVQASLKRSVAASQATSQALDAECKVDRDTAKMEQDALRRALQRAEQSAHLQAEADKQEEQAAKRMARHLEGALASSERSHQLLRHEETERITALKADMEVSARSRQAEAAAELTEERGKASQAASQAQRWKEAHQLASGRIEELQQQLQQRIQQIKDTEASEALALQRAQDSFGIRLTEQKTSLENKLECTKVEHSGALLELRSKAEFLQKDISSAEANAADRQRIHEVAAATWKQQQEQQTKESDQQLQEAQRNQKELVQQRECLLAEEQAQIAQLRAEVTKSLDEAAEQQRATKLATREAAQRESELLDETRKLSAQVRDLERSLTEQKSESNHLQETLAAVSRNRSREQEALEKYRDELLQKDATARVHSAELEAEMSKAARGAVSEQSQALLLGRLREELAGKSGQLANEEKARQDVAGRMRDLESSREALFVMHQRTQEECRTFQMLHQRELLRVQELEGTLISRLDQIDREVLQVRRLKEAMSPIPVQASPLAPAPAPSPPTQLPPRLLAERLDYRFGQM
eukprot:TRINITY_DN47335_c0_g1_i1.p1 TRINITY_DN47335_c0_g1~~TRINITY_DN47335_c0_g1_i1.p1  ORF type:complete len:671 (-),score=234.02 TRINITY_DN47335_c0_g1_i1:48-2060(-)